MNNAKNGSLKALGAFSLLCSLGLSVAASASPFLLEQGRTSAGLSYTNTQATGLALSNGKTAPWWKDDFKIVSNIFTLNVQHGLAENLNGDMQLSYAIVDNDGTTPAAGPVPKDEEAYSNLSNATFGLNYRFAAFDPYYASARISGSFPGAQDYVGTLISPNAGMPSYKLEVQNAVYLSGFLGTLDLGYATRPANSPNQFSYQAGLGYVHDFVALQFIFGGVESNTGDDIGPKWMGKVTKDNEGRPLRPFHLLRENYKKWGVTAATYFNDHSISVTYLAKLEDGATNTDINSNISLGYSYEFTSVPAQVMEVE